MNQETASKAQEKAKPAVRQANIGDFDKIYPLLAEMNSTRLSREDWFRLFQNHWSMDEFSPGMVLELEDQIVGFIGTVFSRQTVDGSPRIFCNLTTWIVREEFRSHSIMMIFSLVRRKDIVLTSFSSNDVTYEIYKKLGFRDGNGVKRIVYPFPSLRSKKYELLTDPLEIARTISDKNRKVFDAHKTFGNVYILVKLDGDECLLLGVSGKGLLNVYFASDVIFLQRHLKHLRKRIMSACGVDKIIVDEHLLGNAFLFLSRKVVWGNPYQYKAVKDEVLSPTPLYSEIFLLNL